MEFLLCGCRFSGFALVISLDNQQGGGTQLHGDGIGRGVHGELILVVALLDHQIN